MKPKLPYYADDKKDKQTFYYNDVSRFLHKFNSIDICFIFDTTSSMVRHVDMVMRNIEKILSEIYEKTFSYPRLALIEFKDFDKKNNIIDHTTVHDFMGDDNTNHENDFTILKELLKKIKCTGGGDACEDLVLPLRKALTLNWKSEQKFICLLIDAPTHGKSYHLDKYSDDYKDLDEKHELEKLVAHFKKFKINLIIIHCTNTVDIMINKIREVYDSDINKLCTISIKEYLKHPRLNDFLIGSISKSVKETFFNNFREYKGIYEGFLLDSKSNKKSEDEKKQSKDNSEEEQKSEDNNEEKSKTIKFRGQIYTCLICGPGFENSDFGFTTKKEKGSILNFEMQTQVIGKGSFSCCYYLKQVPEDKRYIAKIPKINVKNSYGLLSDMDGSLITKKLAKTFSGLIKQGNDPIECLSLVIIRIVDNVDFFGRSK